MRGVGGPLLCIGDLLTDVGEGDSGDGVEKSLASTSTTAIVPNPKDGRSATDLNHVIEIDQIFESSWTIPKYKSHSNSLERQNENKRSSQSSTVNVSDIVMHVGVSCAKTTYFNRASTENETCCLSPPKLDRINSSEKNGRKDGENVEVEKCALDPTMEDEVKDGEGTPPNELQPQILNLTGSGSEHVRVDCSSYFKTDKEFQTKEEVVHWAKLQGRKCGTVIVMSKSQTPYRGRTPRLYLNCERFGKYKDRGVSPKGLRKTGTKKCACPFELGTTWCRVGEEWKAKVHVRNGIHNHQLGKLTEGHSTAGRLTKEELGIVADLTKAGKKPRDILQTLRKNDPENCTTVQQLYNAINTIKSKGMCEKSHRQPLPMELNDNTSIDYNHNLEDVMDVGDGEAEKINNETTLPDDETCCTSPPKVDRVNSTEEEGREDVENVDVENYTLDLTMEDEVIPLKEDECILSLKEQQSQTTQILQSYRKGREYDENVDVENCLPDTQMEDEVVSTNIEEVMEVEGIPPNEGLSRTSQTTQVSQSFPSGRGDIENCVLDTPMEDGSVDCSSQFKTDKEFRTKEEVLHWAKLQGRQTGTVLMISKSQGPYQGRTPRLYLKCDRGGKYRSHADKKHLRKTGTKKCACPFELGTTWSRVDEKEWKIKVYVRNGFHNHQLEKFKEGYSYAGKLTQEELDIVAVLAKAGVKPSEIMDALRKNDPGNCTSRKQLYNTIRSVRSKGIGENYKQLNEALSETGHSWTALTLKLCTALETADKLIQSANSDAKALPEKVEKLQNIMRRGDAAVKSIKLVNSSKP